MFTFLENAWEGNPEEGFRRKFQEGDFVRRIAPPKQSNARQDVFYLTPNRYGTIYPE